MRGLRGPPIPVPIFVGHNGGARFQLIFTFFREEVRTQRSGSCAQGHTAGVPTPGFGPVLLPAEMAKGARLTCIFTVTRCVMSKGNARQVKGSGSCFFRKERPRGPQLKAIRPNLRVSAGSSLMSASLVPVLVWWFPRHGTWPLLPRPLRTGGRLVFPRHPLCSHSASWRVPNVSHFLCPQCMLQRLPVTGPTWVTCRLRPISQGQGGKLTWHVRWPMCVMGRLSPHVLHSAPSGQLRRRVATSADIPFWVFAATMGVLLAAGGQRPGVLLNILHFTGWPPQPTY